MPNPFNNILNKTKNLLDKSGLKNPSPEIDLEKLRRDGKITPSQIEKWASETRILADPKVVTLMENFLVNRRVHGSKKEQALYKDMTIEQFVTRLFSKRPLTFITSADHALLRNGKSIKGGFENIGTDQEKEPLTLQEYLSYPEISIAALLSVSSENYNINNGKRSNAGVPSPESDHETHGIIIGQVGARFEKRGVMEWQHMIVTEENTPQNGYGNPAHKDFNHNPRLDPFATFYDLDYFPSLEEAEADTTNYIKVYAGYLNKGVYKERMRVLIEVFLEEANERAGMQGKKAYVNAVGLGLGYWQIDGEVQGQIIVDIYKELLEKNSYPHISDVDLTYFSDKITLGQSNEPPVKELKVGEILLHLSKRNPADKLTGSNTGKLLVENFAWDGNSQPGNEFWQGLLSASGDPAAAARSLVSYLHNALINPAVNGKNLFIYGKGIQKAQVLDKKSLDIRVGKGLFTDYHDKLSALKKANIYKIQEVPKITHTIEDEFKRISKERKQGTKISITNLHLAKVNKHLEALLEAENRFNKLDKEFLQKITALQNSLKFNTEIGQEEYFNILTAYNALKDNLPNEKSFESVYKQLETINKQVDVWQKEEDNFRKLDSEFLEKFKALEDTLKFRTKEGKKEYSTFLREYNTFKEKLFLPESVEAPSRQLATLIARVEAWQKEEDNFKKLNNEFLSKFNYLDNTSKFPSEEGKSDYSHILREYTSFKEKLFQPESVEAASRQLNKIMELVDIWRLEDTLEKQFEVLKKSVALPLPNPSYTHLQNELNETFKLHKKDRTKYLALLKAGEVDVKGYIKSYTAKLINPLRAFPDKPKRNFFIRWLDTLSGAEGFIKEEAKSLESYKNNLKGIETGLNNGKLVSPEDITLLHQDLQNIQRAAQLRHRGQTFNLFAFLGLTQSTTANKAGGLLIQLEADFPWVKPKVDEQAIGLKSNTSTNPYNHPSLQNVTKKTPKEEPLATVPEVLQSAPLSKPNAYEQLLKQINAIHPKPFISLSIPINSGYVNIYEQLNMDFLELKQNLKKEKIPLEEIDTKLTGLVKLLDKLKEASPRNEKIVEEMKTALHRPEKIQSNIDHEVNVSGFSP